MTLAPWRQPRHEGRRLRQRHGSIELGRTADERGRVGYHHFRVRLPAGYPPVTSWPEHDAGPLEVRLLAVAGVVAVVGAAAVAVAVVEAARSSRNSRLLTSGRSKANVIKLFTAVNYGFSY